MPESANTLFEAFIGTGEKKKEESSEGESDDDETTSSSEEDDTPVADLSGLFNASLDAGADASTAAMSIVVSQVTELTKQITKLKKTKPKKTTRKSGTENHRLGKIPNDSGHNGLPTCRSWLSWLKTKFKPWAALAAKDFDRHVLKNLFMRRAAPLVPPELSSRLKRD